MQDKQESDKESSEDCQAMGKMVIPLVGVGHEKGWPIIIGILPLKMMQS